MIYLARKLNQSYSCINSLRLIELAKSDLLILMTLIELAGTVAGKLESGAKVTNLDTRQG